MKPSICAVIVNKDLSVIKKVEPLVDLFELRIDLVGEGWQELTRQLKIPWIACNRFVSEGGNWRGNETARLDQLIEAIALGANIVDVELATKDLEKMVLKIKKKAQCLLSYHDLKKTPPLDEMKGIVQRQLDAGGDICKVVTTARTATDSVTVLQLIAAFPKHRIVALAMGPLGATSRILAPLVGGDFTYASMETGKESAPGQLTVDDMKTIYTMLPC